MSLLLCPTSDVRAGSTTTGACSNPICAQLEAIRTSESANGYPGRRQTATFTTSTGMSIGIGQPTLQKRESSEGAGIAIHRIDLLSPSRRDQKCETAQPSS